MAKKTNYTYVFGVVANGNTQMFGLAGRKEMQRAVMSINREGKAFAFEVGRMTEEKFMKMYGNK
jgi:hypothetical protein